MVGVEAGVGSVRRRKRKGSEVLLQTKAGVTVLKAFMGKKRFLWPCSDAKLSVTLRLNPAIFLAHSHLLS